MKIDENEVDGAAAEAAAALVFKAPSKTAADRLSCDAGGTRLRIARRRLQAADWSGWLDLYAAVQHFLRAQQKKLALITIMEGMELVRGIDTPEAAAVRKILTELKGSAERL